MGFVSWHAVTAGRRRLLTLVLGVLALQLVAAVGISYAAGFERVREDLGRFSWPWLFGIVASLAVSFAGYSEAYEGTLPVGAGWSLRRRRLRAVSLAGYGGLLAHGATPIDVAAMRAGGASERDTAVRVCALSGLESAVMAFGGCGAAVAVLVLGLDKPPPSFTLPWAIIPVPGFVVALWLARRYRERLYGERGWRGGVGIFLESIEVVREVLTRPVRRHPAALGMAAFWAGDVGAAWCGMAAFGFQMNTAQLVVGYATGMVFTRRTTPLAGAGLLAVILPVSIWYSGAPLAVAVLGIFVWHLLSLWLPTFLSLGTLGTLRDLVTRHAAPAQGRHRDVEPGTTNRAK